MNPKPRRDEHGIDRTRDNLGRIRPRTSGDDPSNTKVLDNSSKNIVSLPDFKTAGSPVPTLHDMSVAILCGGHIMINLLTICLLT